MIRTVEAEVPDDPGALELVREIVVRIRTRLGREYPFARDGLGGAADGD